MFSSPAPPAPTTSGASSANRTGRSATASSGRVNTIIGDAGFDDRGNWVYMDEHMRYYDATGASTFAESLATRTIEYNRNR